MIAHNISVEKYLSIRDADGDGFVLVNEEGAQVWLSYEQLDEVVHVTGALRHINADAFREKGRDDG